MDNETRICSHCGKEMTQGYIDEYYTAYACSKDCGSKVWGEEFYAWVEENPTQEQLELKTDGEIFWTTFTDYEILED